MKLNSYVLYTKQQLGYIDFFSFVFKNILTFSFEPNTCNSLINNFNRSYTYNFGSTLETKFLAT